MTYQASEYRGDAEYSINCTGDAVIGDDVSFDRATFTGSFRSPKFSGFERVRGTIVKDSYGADKQQHTFTLALADGKTIKIKGRNLYANGTWRRPWMAASELEALNAAFNESLRGAAAIEKHMRGDMARNERDTRRVQEGLR